MDAKVSHTLAAQLAATTLFAQLGDTERARIARATREHKLRRGEILFHRGDPCSGIHVLLTGQVKLAVISTLGKEKVVELLGPGQSFGEEAMFLNQPYSCFAEALSDCKVLHVTRSAIERELGSMSALGKTLLSNMAQRNSDLVDDVESFALASGKERIISFLLHELQGHAIHGDEAVLHLPVHKGVIASRLNLTQEHFSRILHDLQEAGLIAVDGKFIAIPSLSRLRAGLS
ncbi:Crp/Fnr family transcriptional regulator [Azonexus sp. IMCC34839]|uniref:Crp/Fnr family transcriptional regulator n=1 Tax=Azonexus sp. IMCC34839 TaxID=3133695 RepID=UPI00399C18D1